VNGGINRVLLLESQKTEDEDDWGGHTAEEYNVRWCHVALNCKKIHSVGKKLPLTARIAAFRCH
jgi:hypothetical protein